MKLIRTTGIERKQFFSLKFVKEKKMEVVLITVINILILYVHLALSTFIFIAIFLTYNQFMLKKNAVFATSITVPISHMSICI
jgi:hypothetical protein